MIFPFSDDEHGSQPCSLLFGEPLHSTVSMPLSLSCSLVEEPKRGNKRVSEWWLGDGINKKEAAIGEGSCIKKGNWGLPELGGARGAAEAEGGDRSPVDVIARSRENGAAALSLSLSLSLAFIRQTMKENNGSLHVVVLPWLAMGHILPFFELSRRLASKGHHVSFLTTRKNIERLKPKIPYHLSHLLILVEFSLPLIEHLPESVENTVDLTDEFNRQYLRVGFDSFQDQFSDFLHRETPDWVIYDYAAYWVPDIGERHGVPCAYLSLFSAAVLGFIGPFNKRPRSSPDEFTNVPDWIPFPTTVAFHPFEARELFKPGVLPDASGTSESLRFAKGMGKCPFMLIRSCNEFEGVWIELLKELYRKPVIPIGLFPPPAHVESEESSEQWVTTYKWLENQQPGSVVYAAFGSEAKLTNVQADEIAIGLDRSGLRFMWVLREGSPLPEGFEARTEGRGIVCKGWVPQVRILTHPSVGGFLTHGGWNSIVEGLTIGLPMVILPLLFDQGLNARNLVDQGMAAEVPRDPEDGSFNGEGVSKCLRMVMVDEEGERFRAKARECKELLGDKELHDRYIEDLVKYLWDHRKQEPLPLKL